jgi:ATP-dependent exoDNAse (exonuclease V) beta subunit
LSEREGLIIGGEWLYLVKKFLEEGEEPGTYAFLKLGSRVNHFLIDEFQDTSHPQWEALFPLLEETLSKGGSLFYAGDVKQAIYGWRGGDSRLFGEVAEVHFPSVPPEGRRGKTLTVNYRSLVKIVDFNNELYRLLGDGKCVEVIAEMILGEKAQEESKEYLSQLISRNFADVEQEAAPHLKDGERGEVQICSFLAPAEQLRQEVRGRLIGQMKGVWERRKEGIAVLVRRNRDAEDITAWLMAEGIPVVTENSLRLRSSDLVKGLVAFLSSPMKTWRPFSRKGDGSRRSTRPLREDFLRSPGSTLGPCWPEWVLSLPTTSRERWSRNFSSWSASLRMGSSCIGS